MAESRNQRRLQALRRRARRRGFRPDGRRRRTGLPARSVGLGQIDVAAHDRRLRAPDRRQHHDRRRGGDPASAGAPADRHGLPEPCAVDPHERLQEHRLRPEAPPPAEPTRCAARVEAVLELVGLVRLRQAPAPTSSPAASSSASRSPARWCSSRRSCCSTNRSPASTSICASGCARKCATSSSGCKITTLFVTHGQDEALALADRIVVMRDGRIEQIAAPDMLYREPATPFVAGFIGKMNLIDGTVRETAPSPTRPSPSRCRSATAR